MLVTFHGVRGSTPCHGMDISRYGGNTSCVSVATPGEEPLLFDLGTGLRYYGLDVERDGTSFQGTCLLSHLHWDHVQGLPFFTPLHDPDAKLVVYAPPQDNGRSAEDILAATISPPLFPIGLHGFPGTIEIREAKPWFEVGGYEVASADVPHVGPTYGYRVTHSGRSVAYVSDHQQPMNALSVDRRVKELLDGVDLLIHDAQYTPPEFARKHNWGHCTVEYAVWVASRVGARRLALYHHDPNRDDDRLDWLVGAAKACGASMGVEVFAAAEGMTVEV